MSRIWKMELDDPEYPEYTGAFIYDFGKYIWDWLNGHRKHDIRQWSRAL